MPFLPPKKYKQTNIIVVTAVKAEIILNTNLKIFTAFYRLAIVTIIIARFC